jgi:hypothetical protein
MRTGGENGEAVRGRHRRDRLAQVPQFRARVRHAQMGRGHHLDLRLQEFRRDAAGGCGFGGVEERRRRVLDDGLRLRVDQEIFLFDSEREFAGHPWTSRLRSCGSGVVH